MNQATPRNVSTTTPQLSYSWATPDTKASLSRLDWHLTRGTLQLSPDTQWRQANVDISETVTFPMLTLIAPWRPNTQEEHILTTQLFSLLVQHRLLEHPERLIEDSGEHSGHIQESLALLRSRIQGLLDAKSFQGLYCQECEKLKWSTLTSQQRYRIYWHNRVTEEICPHIKLLAPVMRQMFTQFPELLLEVLEIIIPERDLRSKERPTRFTLTPYAFLASVGQRLLGQSQERVRDTIIGERERRRPRSFARLPPEEKKRLESVYLSASAWGYTERVETLIEDAPSELYPTLGGAPLPPKEKKELTIPPTTAPTEAKQPTPTPESEAVSMDAKIFLQEVGENNDTLAEMMIQMKLLAPSVQKQLMRLPMKKVIDLWFDIEE